MDHWEHGMDEGPAGSPRELVYLDPRIHCREFVCVCVALETTASL